MGPFDATSRSTNEQLADKSVRRALLLERLKNAHVREVVGQLNEDLFPELLARIESRLDRLRLRGFGSGAIDTQRYQDLLNAIDREIAAGVQAVRQTAVELFQASAVGEATSLVDAVARSVPRAIDFAFEAPSSATLRALVTEHPIRGHTLDDWFSALGQDTQSRVTAEVTRGIVEGQTTPEIVSRIRGTPDLAGSDGILEITRRQAETLVRTATTDVSALAREQTFQENEGVIKGVLWISTLDSRTCAVCGSRDGQVYPVGEGPRPAAHPACRCTVSAVLKSWSELGIKGMKELAPSTRASMNGQVPKSLRYGDWLKTQPAAIQDEALGVTRARAFRAGDVKFDQFVDDRRGRILTLADMRALELLN